MASVYPTSLDNFTNNTDNVDTVVAQDVNDLNDAVEALEAKVGVDDSAVATSIDYILKNKIWPVGSIYINAGVSTNPATLLGFGTWTAFGAGKMIIGIDGTDGDFDSLSDTGGAKTSTALIAHTHTGPSHTHTGTTAEEPADHVHSGTTSGQSATHNHGYSSGDGTTSSGYAADTNVDDKTQYTDNASADHTHTITTGGRSAAHTHSITTAAGGTGATGSTGSGSSFSIMNPFVTAYMWKRTA